MDTWDWTCQELCGGCQTQTPPREVFRLLFTIVVLGSDFACCSCLLGMKKQELSDLKLYPELVQLLLMLCIVLSMELRYRKGDYPNWMPREREREFPIEHSSNSEPQAENTVGFVWAVLIINSLGKPSLRMLKASQFLILETSIEDSEGKHKILELSGHVSGAWTVVCLRPQWRSWGWLSRTPRSLHSVCPQTFHSVEERIVDTMFSQTSSLVPIFLMP